jgi:hypothetical protein
VTLHPIPQRAIKSKVVTTGNASDDTGLDTTLQLTTGQDDYNNEQTVLLDAASQDHHSLEEDEDCDEPACNTQQRFDK